MKEPYIPGFLAFREVDFLLERLEKVRENYPELIPQVGVKIMCKWIIICTLFILYIYYESVNERVSKNCARIYTR